MQFGVVIKGAFSFVHSGVTSHTVKHAIMIHLESHAIPVSDSSLEKF